jgi:hypothetical protein
MTLYPPQQGTFEERLLEQCRQYVAEQPATPAPRRRRAPGWGLVASGLAAAGLAAALMLPLLADGAATGPRPAPPRETTMDAFTISAEQGGALRLTLWLRGPGDAAALERQLKATGVDADVTYLPDGKTCADINRFANTDAPSKFPRPGEQRVGASTGLRIPEFLVEPSRIGPGDALVVMGGPIGTTQQGYSYGIGPGPISECVLVDRKP